MAIGLSQKTGVRGISPDSIISFRIKRNFCVRSTANAGTITLPPTLHGLANQAGELRARVGIGMLPVAIGRLHHEHVGGLAFLWPGVHDLAGRNFTSRTRPMSPVKKQPAGLSVLVLSANSRHARSPEYARLARGTKAPG